MKKNKKYRIIKNDKTIGSMLTKKATIEWLIDFVNNLSDSEQILFAKEVYGENIVKKNFSSTIIKKINIIAANERLPKLLKKDIIIDDVVIKIQLED